MQINLGRSLFSILGVSKSENSARRDIIIMHERVYGAHVDGNVGGPGGWDSFGSSCRCHVTMNKPNFFMILAGDTRARL